MDFIKIIAPVYDNKMSKGWFMEVKNFFACAANDPMDDTDDKMIQGLHREAHCI